MKYKWGWCLTAGWTEKYVCEVSINGFTRQSDMNSTFLQMYAEFKSNLISTSIYLLDPAVWQCDFSFKMHL